MQRSTYNEIFDVKTSISLHYLQDFITTHDLIELVGQGHYVTQ